MRRSVLVIGWLLLVWGAVVDAGEGVLIDKVVAIVNDDVVTLSQLQEESRPLMQRMREELLEQDLDGQLQITEREILDAMVLRRLQIQEAEKQRIAVDQNQVNAAIEQIKRQNGFISDAQFVEALKQQHLTLERLKTKVWEQMVVDALLVRNVRSGIVVSEEEITVYYREHAEQFRRPASVRIRHILLRLPHNPSAESLAEARSRAAELLAQLRKGADFATMAVQYSDGGAAGEGGDLGMLHKGELHPALEAVAFALEPGSISDVIETGAGLNILKVEERTGGESLSAGVREEIRQVLFSRKLVDRMNEYFEELKKQAYIDIRLNE